MKIDPLVALAIAEALIVHGTEAFVAIQGSFENGDPTPEDIRALKIIKDPAGYFEKNG